MSTPVRTLSSPAAQQAVQDMSTILNGNFQSNLDALDRMGKKLSQPDVWDGKVATEFRGVWTKSHQSLMALKEQLVQLEKKINVITADIMQAG